MKMTVPPELAAHARRSWLHMHEQVPYRWGGDERPDPLAPPEGYDHDRPRDDRRQPDEQDREHDTRCAVRLDGVRCLAAPNWTIWFGCLAEHVVPADVCDGHVAESLRDRITCNQCADQQRAVPALVERWLPPGRWLREVPPGELPGLPPRAQQLFSGIFNGRDQDARPAISP